MSEPTPVARLQLRDSYDLDGKPTGRYLYAEQYVMAYEEDTDKMVVNRRGSATIHVIPWANILGFEIQKKAPATVVQEAANGRPAPAVGAGSGSRRARAPQ